MIAIKNMQANNREISKIRRGIKLLLGNKMANSHWRKVTKR